MNTKLLEVALKQERTMMVHFIALSELLGDDPISREDFARIYPRTHNAVVTGKPYSFELPSNDTI